MSNFFSFEPKVNDFNLSKTRLINVMGYDSNTVPEAVVESLDKNLQVSLNSSVIKCGFKIYSEDEIEISKTKLTILGIEFDIQSIIGLHLRKADSVAIFAATLGKQFDLLIKASKGNDMLDAFIIDTIGSELIELVGDWLEQKIAEHVGNKNISNRLSPGYCGWNVSEQHKLFGLLGSNCCGINLSESSLMNPIKSISGIMGIGKNLVRQDYQCKICSIDHCYKRNRVAKENG